MCYHINVAKYGFQIRQIMNGVVFEKVFLELSYVFFLSLTLRKKKKKICSQRLIRCFKICPGENQKTLV